MSKKILVSFTVVFLFLVFMAPDCHQKKPDLVVDSITITPTNPTTADQILFKAVIKNNGRGCASNSAAAMWIGGETNPQLFNIPALCAGAIHIIQGSKQLNVAQNYQVTVYADYGKKLVEANENNNEEYKEFTVINSPPLQVISPTNSEDFQISNARYILTVRFGKDVDTSTVISRSTFIVDFPKDTNAEGTFQWQDDRTVIWTSVKKIGDLFDWAQDCDFQLTIKDDVKDKLSNTKLDGDKNGTPGGHFVHTYSHGALPVDDSEPVPMEIVEDVAVRNAQSLWGDVYASAPIPYYDLDDTLMGYIFNFRKKKPFPDRENLLETLPPDDPWGKKEYCHITVSSVFSESPIEEYGEFLSEELVQESELEKKAQKALGTASVKLEKVYDLGLAVKWYLFTGGDDRVYIRLLPPAKVYREEEFNMLVREPIRRQRAVEWKAYREAVNELPPKDCKQDWMDQRNGIGLIGDEAPDDDTVVKYARGDNKWKYRYIPYHDLMPFYDWHRGCTPTAAAMCFGYYDRVGMEPGHKNLSRLVSNHRSYLDPVEIERDYHVPDVLLILADRMHTSSEGRTWLYNISPGIEEAAAIKSVFCNAEGHGVVFRDATYKDDLRESVRKGQPSVMWTSGHSVAVKGYKKRDRVGEDKYMAWVHDTHIGEARWHRCKSFYKLHTIECTGIDNILGGSIELNFPEGDTRYDDEWGTIAIGSNQVLLAGHSYDITWKTTHGAGFGTVSAYFWDGVSRTFLGDSNTGAFTWTIPPDLNPTNSGRIDLEFWRSNLGEDHNNLIGEDGSYGPFYVVSCLPDLIVDSITITPTNPTTADRILFEAVIKNNGTTNAGHSQAAMWIGGETYPQLFNIPALAPRAVHSFWETRTLSVAQSYGVRVHADHGRAVMESNEDNNAKVKLFTVRSAPPLQVIYPESAQDFQVVDDKYVLIVKFNTDVDQSTVVTQSTFIVKFPKDANAAGTLQWLNDRTVKWTSQKTTGDLCRGRSRCSFQLTIKDAVKDKVNKKLDGDKNGTPGGHFVHLYNQVG